MDPITAGLLSAGFSLIDDLFTSDEEKAEAKLKLQTMAQQGKLKELEEAVKVITAEANSEHFIVAAWRPITMLTFVVIIANNYILYPYLSLFFAEAPVLAIPEDMWGLLKIGLGGYVVGRSGEKVAQIMKGDKK